MSEGHTMMMSLTIYKLATIFTGLAFAFMGYRLFLHGIFSEAGEMRTNWENRSLVLRKAAPGTFFAVLGAVIVSVSLLRGLSWGDSVGGTDSGIGENPGDRPVMETRRRPTASSVAPTKEALELGRLEVREHIAFLNQLPELLSPALTEPDRRRVSQRTLAVKLYLMHAVWGQDWGPFEDFQLWAEGGAKGGDSQEFRRASEFFAYVQE